MSTSVRPHDDDGLRDLVRQVLRDVLPDLGASTPLRTPECEPAPQVTTGAESVVLRSDADLQAFVRRLLQLFENPKHRDDLRSGRLRFTLAASAVPGQPVPTRRVDRGAVTEAQVKDAARAGASLVLGPGAVLTPLARDRARALGVAVEKEF